MRHLRSSQEPRQSDPVVTELPKQLLLSSYITLDTTIVEKKAHLPDQALLFQVPTQVKRMCPDYFPWAGIFQFEGEEQAFSKR